MAGSTEFSFTADHIRKYLLTPGCPGCGRGTWKEAKETEEVSITTIQAGPFPKAHSHASSSILRATEPQAWLRLGFDKHRVLEVRCAEAALRPFRIGLYTSQSVCEAHCHWQSLLSSYKPQLMALPRPGLAWSSTSEGPANQNTQVTPSTCL